MKRKPPDSRNALSALRLSLAVSVATLIPLLLYGTGPSWWSQRGVLLEQGAADDYAPANQGQLKNIAKAAFLEMDTKLPGGAGETLRHLVANWSTPRSQTNDFAPVNLGQLKSVAKPFYNRLIAAGFTTAYPWTQSANPADDFAIANIGQIKNLFGFDFFGAVLDSDGNGLPDAWEQRYFGHLGVNPDDDPDGDAATNLQEYQRDTDPNAYDVAPSIVLSPDQLTVVLSPGERRTAMLTMSNASSQSLPFQLTARDDATHDLIFTDSDQPSGPVYEWEDISNTGTLLPRVSGADDEFESFDLGFAFPYFGQSFTSVFVSSNGFITFGEGSDQFSNSELPGADMPANEIAGFHTDLNPRRSGEIFYLNESDRAIIQYEGVDSYGGTGKVTFQIVLKSDGTIDLRYKTLPSVVDDVTVGAQNATRDKGLSVAFGQAYLHPNLTVRFAPGQGWLSASPASGSISSAETRAITVMVDATYLESGRYTGSVELSSSESEPVLVAVPITMIVNHEPTVSLTSPAAGQTLLTSASVTLVAEAADPDGTIAKVQFFLDGQFLGETVSAPSNFVWVAPTLGAHVLTARATDDMGKSTASADIGITVLADSDSDSVSDDWERAHFGDLSQTAEGDFDRDGISNGDEYRTGTDPSDYFNGTLPAILVVAGDNQRGPAGEVLPVSLTVRVTDQQGAPRANAPVHFQVATGDSQIVLDAGGTALSTQVQTNAAGEASVFCHAPQTRGSRSTIAAECRSGSQTAAVSFVETSEAFLEATPQSLAFVINLPGTQPKTVQLHNNGPLSLDFSLETDATSYRFLDSTMPDGPAYEWNDISATGTLLAVISQSDDDFEAVDLPFAFPFFGQDFSRIYVASNGFVTVGAGAAWGWHGPLPGFNMPPGEIAAFHTDLNPAAGGHIYYLNGSDRTVIQFDQVEQSDGSGPVTFQIVLEQTGAITFLYNSMNGTLNAASVGIQNLLQDQGVEVTYNKAYLGNNLAVRLTRDNSWLQVSPATGQIEPGQTVDITVTGDGAHLSEGNYAGLLRVRSVADQSVLELPVTAAANASPIVKIIAPQQNAGVVVSETLSVEVQAQDRHGQVRKVDFYEGSNLIGVVTDSPFVIGWHAPQAGSFTLTARATDDLGATGKSLPVSVHVEEDSDGDGLGDQWEMANFGNLDQTANGDYDGDGRSNRQEFHDNTPADDYYNGGTPYPRLLTRTRAAGKDMHGFRPFIPTNPFRYFLQSQSVIHLIGGNPESEVNAIITTRLDPDTGSVVEDTATGNAANLRYYPWAPASSPTETIRVDRFALPFARENSDNGAYNDPPNLVDDGPAVAERTTTLSDEYTFDQMVSRTRAALPPIPPFDAPSSAKDDANFAYFEFYLNDQAVYMTHSNYQFQWKPSPNLPEQKKVSCLEIFYPFNDPRTPAPEDFTPITTVRSWEGTANETPVYYLSPPVPGYYSLTTISADLMVDGDRDGNMSFSEGAVYVKDLTTEQRPYRFWVNDDDDGAAGDPGEHVPPSAPDYADGTIRSIRDLEDFARLHVNVAGLEASLESGEIKAAFEWKQTSNSPRIKLYRAASGGTDYLTSESKASATMLFPFRDTLGEVAPGVPLFMPQDFWVSRSQISNVPKTLPVAWFLFEGSGEGKGQLILSLWEDGQKIGETAGVWLDLKDVKQMYQRATATPNSLSEPYASNANPIDDENISYTSDVTPRFDPSPGEDEQCLIFVHGWKATEDDATSAGQTMFKRLWWEGYKGRFATLRWPTKTSVFSYNTSEWLAWKYGKSLDDYVTKYVRHQLPSYRVSVAAHSMGNIVTGAALKRGMTLDRYMLMEAAIPAGCYEDSVNTYTRFVDAEATHPTPDTMSQMGYRLFLSSARANVVKFISFFNIDDFALATGMKRVIWLPFETNWEKNQIDYKPDTIGSGQYLYLGGNTSQYLTGAEGDFRQIIDVHESMAFVARPRSKAAGAELHNATVFGSVFNLKTSCNFGADVDDHSGQFTRSIQQLRPFYQRMVSELKQ